MPNLTEDELRDLVERTHQVRTLTESSEWPYFEDRVKVIARSFSDRILAGHMDEAEYKFSCGVLEGVRLVLGIPERIADEAKRAQEDYERLQGAQ
jgi:hypothetical protein